MTNSIVFYQKAKHNYVKNKGQYNNDTVVKSYSYDKNNHIHYGEFLDDVSLNDRFIETIVIAKESGEQVTLNIDRVPFIIDVEFVKDKMIVDNGIELVDSRPYYDVITRLMAIIMIKLQTNMYFVNK